MATHLESGTSLETQSIHDQILAAEERLRQAMLTSDVAVLDELLAPDLLFIGHLGQLARKEEDLAIHRSGSLKIHTIEPQERHIQIYDDVVVVAARMHMTGINEEIPFDGALQYLRVWRRSDSQLWQIIAGNVTPVQQ